MAGNGKYTLGTNRGTCHNGSHVFLDEADFQGTTTFSGTQTFSGTPTFSTPMTADDINAQDITATNITASQQIAADSLQVTGGIACQTCTGTTADFTSVQAGSVLYDGADQTALGKYREHSLVTSFTGIWAADQPVVILATRIGRMVQLIIPEVQAVANAASFMATNDALPADFLPLISDDTVDFCWIIDNGGQALGRVVVSNTGFVNINRIEPVANFGANFTGAGVSGTSQTNVISYVGA